MEVTKNRDAHRLVFSEDTWWEVTSFMPFGVSRRVQRIASTLIDAETDDALQVDLKVKQMDSAADAMDVQDRIMLERLVGCTVKWSWRDEVTPDNIDRRDSVLVSQVYEYMNELHKPRDEKETRKLKKR